jgi:hypothetical protein
MARDLHLSDYMFGIIASSKLRGYLIGAFTAVISEKRASKKKTVGRSKLCRKLRDAGAYVR